MSRALGFLTGALDSSPLLTVGEAEASFPRLSGVPGLRQPGHRCGRHHAGGPTDGVLGEEATPPPSPHPPWRPERPTSGGGVNSPPRRTPAARRPSSEGAPSRDAELTCVPPDPDPGLPPGGSRWHVRRPAGPDLGIRPSGPAGHHPARIAGPRPPGNFPERITATVQGALGPRPRKRPSGPEAPRPPLVLTCFPSRRDS